MISRTSLITQLPVKLIKNLVWACLFALFCASCQDKNPILKLPTGETIKIRLAIKEADQIKGLSSLAPGQFADNEGMLFYYEADDYRSFWMPDTYFDLDIFFLDENFKILNVERNVPHHPGRQEPPRIYRTASYYSRHVLELKASSPLAKKIKKGMTLSPSFLLETK